MIEYTLDSSFLNVALAGLWGGGMLAIALRSRRHKRSTLNGGGSAEC
jgi:hypothetical protein